MPLLVNENGVIERITFDKPVAEEPLRWEWLRVFMNSFWRVLSGPN